MTSHHYPLLQTEKINLLRDDSDNQIHKQKAKAVVFGEYKFVKYNKLEDDWRGLRHLNPIGLSV